MKKYLRFLIIGAFFGLVLYKAEVVSWFRIQEMFRFHSFHMYGVIGSAVVVGALSLFLIRKFKVKTIDGEEIDPKRHKFSKGAIFGGLIFGFGWVLTGACPGPLYTLVGGGYYIVVIPLISALLGVWVYGLFRDKLPQ